MLKRWNEFDIIASWFVLIPAAMMALVLLVPIGPEKPIKWMVEYQPAVLKCYGEKGRVLSGKALLDACSHEWLAATTP